MDVMYSIYYICIFFNEQTQTFLYLCREIAVQIILQNVWSNLGITPCRAYDLFARKNKNKKCRWTTIAMCKEGFI